MFSADPFSNIPFCGSTVTPIFPYVKREIHREVLSLCMPKVSLKLNIPSHADRVVITLQITNLNLHLNRK